MTRFFEAQDKRDEALRAAILAAREAGTAAEPTSIRDLVEGLGLLASVYVGVIGIAVAISAAAQLF